MKASDITGLTYQELLNYPTAELHDMLATVSKAANQRITRLEKAGVASYSPAYSALSQGRTASGKKGRFGVGKIAKEETGKKQRMKYIQEIMRANSFMQSESSQVKRSKELKRDFDAQFGETTRKQRERAFAVKDKLEQMGHFQSSVGSLTTLQVIIDIVKNTRVRSVDKLVDMAEEALRPIYEEQQIKEYRAAQARYEFFK